MMCLSPYHCQFNAIERVLSLKLNNTVRHAIQIQQGTQHDSPPQNCIAIGYQCNEQEVLMSQNAQRGFDTVWCNGLLCKLATLHNSPFFFVKLLQGYLADRTFQVRVEGSLSTQKKNTLGGVQGAVLALLLFNFYTADIPSFPGTNFSMFVDDVLIYTSNFSVNVARQKYNSISKS